MLTVGQVLVEEARREAASVAAAEPRARDLDLAPWFFFERWLEEWCKVVLPKS